MKQMIQKNKFIAIEGLDGSGKSTQIDLLINYLKSNGIEVKFVHFPRLNKGFFGELISKFLRGEFGNVQNVHPQLVALLFAGDRKEFSDSIKEWLKKGYFVLVDRYVMSNIVFQCAKLSNPNERQELQAWINNFEYNYNQIPKPDLSLYLDVPFSFIEQSLKNTRLGEERDYLKGKDDIHEKDFSLQLSVKNEYENLINTDASIRRVICYDSENKMKKVLEIHNEIVSCLNGTLNKFANN